MNTEEIPFETARAKLAREVFDALRRLIETAETFLATPEHEELSALNAAIAHARHFIRVQSATRAMDGADTYFNARGGL